MGLQVLLGFVNENGEPLFSAGAGFVPRAGDTVCYSMEALDRDEWNDEAWADKHAISGKEWTVLRVHHDFRRMSVNRPEAQVLYVYVTPNVELSALTRATATRSATE